MHIRYLYIFIVSLLALSFLVNSQDKEHKYIGSKKCKTCHNSTKAGKQYKIWAESAHAKAYESLKSDKAMEIAKTQGVEDPLKSEKCLTCHTTAYGKEKLWSKSYKIEEGVGCESCHGAGSDYKSMKVMKSKEASMASGMLDPDEKSCLTCHTDDNPGHKGGFDYKTNWAKIAHPIKERRK